SKRWESMSCGHSKRNTCCGTRRRSACFIGPAFRCPADLRGKDCPWDCKFLASPEPMRPCCDSLMHTSRRRSGTNACRGSEINSPRRHGDHGENSIETELRALRVSVVNLLLLRAATLRTPPTQARAVTQFQTHAARQLGLRFSGR